MFHVYWIKRSIHTNVHTDGYVGVSVDPSRRLAEHYHNPVNPHLKSALSKYTDIEITVLSSFDEAIDAYRYETRLRPGPNIGWNIDAGGMEPPRYHLTEQTRQKISQTHKRKGTTPFSANTTSKAAILKRKEALRAKKMKWYHDPDTLEARQVKTALESPPQGWILGRVPKRPARVRGKDYVCHVANWAVVDPQGTRHEVYNLKEWCRDRDIPYLATFKRGWKGWLAHKQS